MCRGAEFCTELGTDPSQWDKRCPLPPPDYFESCLDNFVQAFIEARKGNINSSLKFLEKTRSDELRQWYVEHGQMSGHQHRVKGLGLPKPVTFQGELEKDREPGAELEKEVLIRDGYRCRYCQTRVLDLKVLESMEKIVGIQHFRVKGKNEERHGIVLAFRATNDHVIPSSLGGKTTIDNLVTSCWNCNIGKLNALVEQMGIDNPFEHPIDEKLKWDGTLSNV